MPEYPPERINFAFTVDGAAAACLASVGTDRVLAESMMFDGSAPTQYELDQADGSPSFVTPLPDGRVLLARAIPEIGFEFVVLHGDAMNRLGAVECHKLRVRGSADPATLAVVTARTGSTEGAVWRVAEDGVHLVTALPRLQLVGGGWLAPGKFGVNRLDEHGRMSPVVVDLRSGVVRALRPRRPLCAEILQLRSAGTAMVASDVSGKFQFGFGAMDERGQLGELTFPPGLNGIDGTVLPIAVDRAGSTVALNVSKGVHSKIVCYDIATDSCADLDLPLGTLAGPARFGEDGRVLRLAFSTPAEPTDVLTVDRAGLRPPAFVPRPGAAKAAMGVRLESFPGKDGPIEALVYGRPDWQHARQVLIALHGGPEDAWRPRFDPLFQRLESAGLSVIAPNPRGSTHYGQSFQNAIRGAWGGPDLADVCHLARDVAARAPGAELLLYGLSYGAYLALLTAGVLPGLWRRCVVVAPFLSGPRLYAEASPSVRKLIDRLDGHTQLADAIGPRDVLRFAPSISAELLVVHGSADPTIPVGQSRQLREALLDAGSSEGVDFGYWEVPGEGHYPRFDTDGTSVHACLTEFLLRGRLPEHALPARAAASA